MSFGRKAVVIGAVLGALGTGLEAAGHYDVPASWTAGLAANSLPPELGDPVTPTYVCPIETVATDTCNANTALATFSNGKQTKIDALSAVSDTALAAIIDQEDHGFLKHPGISSRSMLRAGLTDFYYSVKAQRLVYVQGGSTITQQLTKLMYPQPKDPIDQKMQEIHFALALEKKYAQEGKNPKVEVMKNYLNRVPLNNNTFGIEAASEVDFGIHASELDLVRSATLAGLIRNPSASRERMLKNRDHVLNIMYKDGDVQPVVDPQTKKILKSAKVVLDEAIKTPLEAYMKPRIQNNGVDMTKAHAIGAEFEVNMAMSETAMQLNITPQQVATQGLRIYMTLSLTKQKAAYDVTHAANLSPGEAVALANIGPKGGLLALIGGPDYNVSQVNLANGESGGGRQMGSTVKLFFLADALQHGDKLSTPYPSPPSIKIPKADNGKDWVVSGGECGGKPNCVYTLADALAFSSNTVFTQVAAKYGVEGALRIMRMAGMNVPMSTNLSAVLGTTNSDPVAVAEGFNAILENHGVATPYYTVEKVTAGDGQRIYIHEPGQPKQIVDQSIADMAAQAAQGPVQKGTAAASITLKEGSVGKTGTTDNSVDTWFTGGRPDKGTTSVWVGNPKASVAYPNAFGGKLPASIWNSYEIAIATTA